MANTKLIQFLLDHNQEQSKAYAGSDAVLWRQQYRAKHPTEIAALKCMDGRLNFAVMTGMPPGIIQPFRNIGGKFDLGWPFFGALIREWIEYAISRGRDAMVLVTYHFSKGDPHRGCKGFGYDIAAAQKGTTILKAQFEHVFGGSHQIVYPVMVGIETDEDALVLHGSKGEVFNVADNVDMSEEDARRTLQSLYPDMRPRFIDDLLPLIVGNQAHIKEVRAMNRTVLDNEHREQILGVGRGFDWLHIPNKALIVGPYSYNLRDPIATAASIILDNLEQGRIPKEEGVVLLTSAVFREARGVEKELAEEKATSLARFAWETVERDVPALLPYLTPLTGTVDMNTREFFPLA